VRKERRERVTGPGPDLSPSVARHHKLHPSVARRRSESPTGRPRDGKIPRARPHARLVFLFAMPTHPLLDMLYDPRF
jgi:hypothetical protein